MLFCELRVFCLSRREHALAKQVSHVAVQYGSHDGVRGGGERVRAREREREGDNERETGGVVRRTALVATHDLMI